MAKLPTNTNSHSDVKELHACLSAMRDASCSARLRYKRNKYRNNTADWCYANPHAAHGAKERFVVCQRGENSNCLTRQCCVLLENTQVPVYGKSSHRCVGRHCHTAQHYLFYVLVTRFFLYYMNSKAVYFGYFPPGINMYLRGFRP